MPILDKNFNISLIINALFSTTTKASKIAIIPIDKENIKKMPQPSPLLKTEKPTKVKNNATIWKALI